MTAARRVVSLVPSFTETVAVSAPHLLVGATQWCTEPAGLAVARIGGTKNPDIEQILKLDPDLVLANEEENRAPDLAALRNAGVTVLETYVRSLSDAFAELDRVHDACGLARPDWLTEARRVWGAEGGSGTVGGAARQRLLAVVPIWRRPWMALGHDTFAGDVLAHLGVGNVLADSEQRYPRFDPAELLEDESRRPALAVLPDEPYRFTPDDGPEAFPGIPSRLVSGRHLTWYGPSLLEARTALARALGGGL
ncbi:MAG: helical backbone metal receptor [Actinomycetales bacterium]